MLFCPAPTSNTVFENVFLHIDFALIIQELEMQSFVVTNHRRVFLLNRSGNSYHKPAFLPPSSFFRIAFRGMRSN